MSKYNVWIEGYSCTGQYSPDEFLATVEAQTFEEACVLAMKEAGFDQESIDTYYKEHNNTFWGCSFYEQDPDAEPKYFKKIENVPRPPKPPVVESATDLEATLSQLEKADKIIKEHYAENPDAAKYGRTGFKKPEIIAVDFDGTLFDIDMNANHKLIDCLIEARKNGAKVILNTFRERSQLDIALKACKEYGLEFDAVNENLPKIEELFGKHRKIYADVYIDDQSETPEW